MNTILSYLDKKNIKKSETNDPWSPNTRLALTVVGRNGYRRCKHRRYTIDLSCLLNSGRHSWLTRPASVFNYPISLVTISDALYS